MKPFWVVWRTALVVVWLSLVLLASLFLCAHWHLPETFFQYAKDGCVALAAIAVIKSGVEHLANGSGLLGALKTLVTDAKPGTPPAGGTAS